MGNLIEKRTFKSVLGDAVKDGLVPRASVYFDVFLQCCYAHRLFCMYVQGCTSRKLIMNLHLYDCWDDQLTV